MAISVISGSVATQSRLKTALGGWHTLHPRVELDRDAQGAAECLERSFRLVVRVVAFEIVDVQGDQRVVDEALKKFAHQIDIELADSSAHEIDLHVEPRPAGQIDHDARQCLVERDVSMAI